MMYVRTRTTYVRTDAMLRSRRHAAVAAALAWSE